MKYFLGWSGGADSTAAAILLIENGEPLDALVYCEVMFTKDISAEVPEHRDFVYNVAKPYFESRGVPVIIVRSEKTALEWMLSRSVKGNGIGKIHGFPLSGNRGWCSIKRDCKLPPLHAFAEQHSDAIFYEGICADEKKRIDPIKAERGAYPAVKYGYSQEMCRGLCLDRGLKSPIYSFAKRNGCFFCPNAGYTELRHLRDHHPELWKSMLAIQGLPDLIRPKFTVDESLFDIEERFACEDAQVNIFDYTEGASA